MNTITADVSVIRNKILEIRGNRVILDYHLAELYGVQTKVLKQAVRRNLQRFPRKILCCYHPGDDFDEKPEYDGLYTELTGTIATVMEEHDLLKDILR